MVFYTIPFKYNRIKKTEQELKAELIAREKKKSAKREHIRNSTRFKKILKRQ